MKTFKKLLSLLLAGVMTLSLLAAVPFTAVAAEGDIDWTQSEIVLDSTADLLAFNTAANDTTTYSYFSGKTVKLGADIDMAGQAWNPITQFRGTIDGQGYAIKNFTINSSAGSVAMFKILRGAKIQNIQFINASITSTSTSSTSMTAVIAAQTKTTTSFENVYLSGKITTPSENVNHKAGSLAAQCDSDSSVSVSKCVSDCEISGGHCGGGLIGYTVSGTNTTLTDCVFSGKMLITRRYTSGLVGAACGNVTFERCLMIGVHATNGWVNESGAMVTAVSAAEAGLIKLIDCYAASCTTDKKDTDASDYLIESTNDSKLSGTVQKNIQIVYEGEMVYGSEEALVALDDTNVIAASAAIRTFAVDETRSDLRQDFAYDYPTLATTMVPVNNQVVTYGITNNGSSYKAENDVYKVNRFMPKTVYQMLVNADFYGVQFTAVDATNQDYDIRFVGTINCDNLKYAETLGFEVVATYMEDGEEVTMTYDCSGSLVYTSVAAVVGTTITEVTAASLGADYLYALSITDIPAAVAEITFTVTPYVRADNSFVLSKAATTLTVTCENNVIAVNGRVIE